MFGRIIFFVFGLYSFVAGFALFVLVFSSTTLGVQNALPLSATILFSVLATAYVAGGIRVMYDGIRDR